MQNWMGDDSQAAYLLNDGHMLLFMNNTDTKYTVLNSEYIRIREGSVSQHDADLDAVAKMIAERIGKEVIAREIYFDTVMKYTEKNFLDVRVKEA